MCSLRSLCTYKKLIQTMKFSSVPTITTSLRTPSPISLNANICTLYVRSFTRGRHVYDSTDILTLTSRLCFGSFAAMKICNKNSDDLFKHDMAGYLRCTDLYLTMQTFLNAHRNFNYSNAILGPIQSGWVSNPVNKHFYVNNSFI